MKLGPGLWALICLDLLNKGAGPKTMIPTQGIGINDLLVKKKKSQ